MASTHKKALNRLSSIRVARLEEPGFCTDGGGPGLQIVARLNDQKRILETSSALRYLNRLPAQT